MHRPRQCWRRRGRCRGCGLKARRVTSASGRVVVASDAPFPFSVPCRFHPEWSRRWNIRVRAGRRMSRTPLGTYTGPVFGLDNIHAGCWTPSARMPAVNDGLWTTSSDACCCFAAPTPRRRHRFIRKSSYCCSRGVQVSIRSVEAPDVPVAVFHAHAGIWHLGRSLSP